MILVDTSVWVEHARRGVDALSGLLEIGEVLSHPFVIGELALGGLRTEALRYVTEQPAAIVATNEEVLALIIRDSLAGRGIGYADTHLLASVRLTPDARLWTLDKRLQSVAADFDVLVRLPT